MRQHGDAQFQAPISLGHKPTRGFLVSGDTSADVREIDSQPAFRLTIAGFAPLASHRCAGLFGAAHRFFCGLAAARIRVFGRHFCDVFLLSAFL